MATRRLCKILNIPVYATTQNRNRLGLTCAELLPYLVPAEAASASASSSASSASAAAAGAAAAAGPTATNVVEHVDKTAFSMCVPAIMRHFGGGGSHSAGGEGGDAGNAGNAGEGGEGDAAGHAPRQTHHIAVVGIEAHVCVTQTALDLLARGHTVYVLADGVSSSHPGEARTALARLRGAGAVVTTSESWLFEVMGDANIPEFRQIQALIKETKADTQAALDTFTTARL